jgi:hypothetical protein
MVTLSNIPGRLRLKSPQLIGKPQLCRQLAAAARRLSNVLEAEASHRTGTLLLRHTGAAEPLIEEVRRLLADCQNGAHPIVEPLPSAPAPDPLRQAAVELAWMGARSLLPKPLGILLPVAQKLLSRRPQAYGS